MAILRNLSITFGTFFSGPIYLLLCFIRSLSLQSVLLSFSYNYTNDFGNSQVPKIYQNRLLFLSNPFCGYFAVGMLGYFYFTNFDNESDNKIIMI
jgi:hypothetical protein